MSPRNPLTLFSKTVPALGALVCAAVVATSPVPAAAQDNSEARLRRAEAEIRALQRAVFPGGDGRFFEPQITSDGAPSSTVTTRTPSTTAVTDILARLDAIETQLQRLTALTEENTNALSNMELRVAALEEQRSAGAVTTPSPSGATPQPSNEPIATNSNLAAMSDGASDGSEDAQSAAAAGPSAERLAAVQEITKPQTDDAGDDEYSYGFRLWNAGFYPEARQQLASYVEGYPDHSQISYGRNLLGRAFLDDGMPEEAARWFLRNYQADRTARRAPDSLLFLAESMIAMGDTRRACIALSEFGETYPAVATGRLADQYESNRRRVTCDG
ncbi:tetratricopeptide repeat protein [uncultured Erythrobacter sp.]|uniref:tetratricopeptide repeat protein n=1 Tax=uncultured Erythrobacter sp. TaxID=263913 RepID=UPI002605FE11|nr:tetratricopeptide repeat protein [uncultured Erythrobacter sp.]